MIYVEYNTKTKLITRVVSAKFTPQSKAGCSIKAMDDSIPIEVGCLLSLVGFAGRDTIIEILKNWRQ